MDARGGKDHSGGPCTSSSQVKDQVTSTCINDSERKDYVISFVFCYLPVKSGIQNFSSSKKSNAAGIKPIKGKSSAMPKDREAIWKIVLQSPHSADSCLCVFGWT